MLLGFGIKVTVEKYLNLRNDSCHRDFGVHICYLVLWRWSNLLIFNWKKKKNKIQIPKLSWMIKNWSKYLKKKCIIEFYEYLSHNLEPAHLFHLALDYVPTLCFIFLRSFAFLWCKMPMFWRTGMREGGKPLPLALQYLIFMV